MYSNNIIIALLIAFIWGLSPVIFKYLIKHNNIPDYIIILIQAIIYVLASILYIFIYKLDYIYNDLYTHKNHIPLLAFLSLLSVYLANVLYLYALSNCVKVNIMSIIVFTITPIVTLIFAFFLLNELLTIKSFIGCCLVIIGVIIIFNDN